MNLYLPIQWTSFSLIIKHKLSARFCVCCFFFIFFLIHNHTSFIALAGTFTPNELNLAGITFAELHAEQHLFGLPFLCVSFGLGSYIKQFQDTVLSNDEIERICSLLIDTEGKISKREHIQSLHDRHSSDTVCPRCGSDLVERIVKQGPRTGTKFVGCGGYPKCRFTLN
jgi:hypothetical protein